MSIFEFIDTFLHSTPVTLLTVIEEGVENIKDKLISKITLLPKIALNILMCILLISI